jgi:hypothetical protein
MWKVQRRIKREIVLLKRRADKVLLDWPMTVDDLAELSSKQIVLQRRLDNIVTQKLLREADRLGIDIREDEHPDWWYKITKDGWSILTQSGQVRVRKLIREEKLANRERLVRLIAPIIGALTGLIGAIIGLIAFLRSSR